ncbi:MAG TPA: ribosome maturation factor RimP [Actinomycetota bacterium]|nr:ribosome maturation factor RimP [Actinomycetota bacterium]
MELEPVLATVVEKAGLELVEVTFRREGGGKILRVTVDREGGVDLETIAATSEKLSRRLDAEGFDPGPYSLEVSSPGVERPLRRPDEFAKRLGDMVKVKTAEPLDGAKVHRGVLVAAGDDAVTIDTEAGERTVPYVEIESARTVFDWGRSERRSGSERRGRTTGGRQGRRK